MTEPPMSAGAVGLTAALIALAGPVVGEYSAILFCSFIGAMWSLSGRPTSEHLPRAEGAWFVFRMMGTAVVFSGAVAWAVERYWGFPAHLALAGVAFFIAFVGDRWRELVTDGIDWLRAKIRGHK
jgi:hypothetical protein